MTFETQMSWNCYFTLCSNSFIKKQSSEFKQNFKMIHISTDEVYGSLGKKGFFNEKKAMILALILHPKQGRTI